MNDRKLIYELLNDMQVESERIANDFGFLETTSLDHICDAIASLSSKQAVICRLLKSTLETERLIEDESK